MDEPTITHWHGLNVPALMDGHPIYALDKGQTFVYEFEMRNRASMILYHPHTHGITGRQVYQGLAGAMLVNDAEEGKLELPSGEFEIPIVIQDRLFDDQNQLIYVRNMHDRMMGFHGDRILVNGRPDFTVDVATRAYRLRILNGSNARIYKLAWDDGSPLTVIGVDGGLLETPVTKPYLMLGPGERLDVWADFSGRAVGSQLVMRSRPFTGVLPKMGMMGMMGGMGMGGMGGMQHGGGGMGMRMGMGGMQHGADDKPREGGHGMGGMGMMGMMGSKLPVGSDYPIFTVRVTRQVSESPNLPTRLCTFTHYGIEDTANPNNPVPLGISEAPGAMLLNGRPYAPNDYLPSERIPFNTLQLVQIFHAHGGEGGHGGGSGSTGSSSGGHGADNKPAETQGGMQHGGMGGMGMMGGMQHGQGMGMGMMGGMQHGGGNGMEGMQHGGGDKSKEGEQSMGGMGGMGGMGMMMSMAHPIHLHEEPFQILSRTIGAEEAEDYATVRDGFVDNGWKDTVLVMPGEKVRIVKPYKSYKGVFMVHCHNLEHEDMGMMREFLVE
jgi:FtsP/CotA-like multicopper oxidase with cupredoxin domain